MWSLNLGHPMPPGHREGVRKVAEELQPPTVEEEIRERYALVIAAWAADHGCVRGDFTDGQAARFRLWQGTGWCVEDAVRVWTAKTRAQFARWLYLTRRIGVDDDRP